VSRVGLADVCTRGMHNIPVHLSPGGRCDATLFGMAVMLGSMTKLVYDARVLDVTMLWWRPVSAATTCRIRVKLRWKLIERCLHYT
jgi:hypothetical protein